MLLYEPTDNRKLNISYSLANLTDSTSRLQTGITDNFATMSLSKLIGGGIKSIDELNAAEQCLRALIFHETVVRQSPCVTVDNLFSPELELDKSPVHLSDYLGTDIIKHYVGNINNLRGFTDEKQAMAEISRRNEKNKQKKELHRKHGFTEPVFSYSSDSCPLGYVANNITDYTRSCFAKDLSLQSRFILPIAQTKLSSYISYPFLLNNFENTALNQEKVYQAKEFFGSIDDVWKLYNEKLRNQIEFSTPVFLNIVLTRASNKDDIGRVILELRDEYRGARAELWRHFDNADECDSKDILIDIEDITKRIFNESLLSSSNMKLVASLDNRKRFVSYLTAGAILFSVADAGTAMAILALTNAYLNSLTVGNSMNMTAARLTVQHIQQLNQEGLFTKFFTPQEIRDIECSLRNYS
ncbi:hypothetical protein [Psychromonas hadalis]|uniref:hypothetical protein n=1 Tax=Psychromonas hadalis TaxID=211669 RepID=UPI0003B75247|nr:hypothetical protein [Psychromonas hadalis]